MLKSKTANFTKISQLSSLNFLLFSQPLREEFVLINFLISMYGAWRRTWCSAFTKALSYNYREEDQETEEGSLQFLGDPTSIVTS